MKKDSLTNKAYLQIKEMIISNLLEPGEIINEAALQELLHIGRTPIHEALLRLSVEQFVTIIPRNLQRPADYRAEHPSKDPLYAGCGLAD